MLNGFFSLFTFCIHALLMATIVLNILHLPLGPSFSQWFVNLMMSVVFIYYCSVANAVAVKRYLFICLFSPFLPFPIFTLAEI